MCGILYGLRGSCTDFVCEPGKLGYIERKRQEGHMMVAKGWIDCSTDWLTGELGLQREPKELEVCLIGLEVAESQQRGIDEQGHQERANVCSKCTEGRRVTGLPREMTRGGIKGAVKPKMFDGWNQTWKQRNTQRICNKQTVLAVIVFQQLIWLISRSHQSFSKPSTPAELSAKMQDPSSRNINQSTTTFTGTISNQSRWLKHPTGKEHAIIKDFGQPQALVQ
ncbi:hypothetical protein BY996DRAFT_6465072 [Phakopsora pachyrhizi]|nr:hypothetical protein BY996DRAFT_6465072 [Phakopsora pachyrhizi]